MILNIPSRSLIKISHRSPIENYLKMVGVNTISATNAVGNVYEYTMTVDLPGIAAADQKNFVVEIFSFDPNTGPQSHF